jgi:hypothetical protein
MIKPKTSLIITVSLLLVVCVCGFVLWCRIPHNFEEVVRKYPKGTPAGKVISDCVGFVKLKQSSAVWGWEPTERDKRVALSYYITIRWADAYLRFNYYQELIRVDRISESKNPD